ncbi:MAG: type I-E CRISPR-associated protein Cse2/CasB [Magnetococcales bacterium]|nr:type I-E CRISPR-associated protein Cse2/CasB [Magnetococcales bacterium]
MNDLSPTPQPEASLKDKILSLASRLSRSDHEGGLSTGEVAELRRWRLGGDIHPAAWRLLAQLSDGEQGMRREMEDRWLAVLAGMAHMAPQPHRSGFDAAPGRVLAAAGYSENRFHKLLNSRNEAFFDAVEGACRFLRAKGEAVDWTRFAPFILTLDPDKAETQRRTLARDYFSHQQP